MVPSLMLDEPPIEPASVPDPDRALVRRMAAGEAEAHAALYEAHGRAVLAYLVGRIGDEAEELLHDVMLAAWRGAAAFRGDSRVRTWLLAIAHNAACNALRRRDRMMLVAEPGGVAAMRDGRLAARLGGRLDERLDLQAAIARLPDGQQAVLELVFVHGLSQDEAAAVLGVAPGTIKSRLNRAKERLRAHLIDGADSAEGHHV